LHESHAVPGTHRPPASNQHTHAHAHAHTTPSPLAFLIANGRSLRAAHCSAARRANATHESEVAELRHKLALHVDDQVAMERTIVSLRDALQRAGQPPVRDGGHAPAASSGMAEVEEFKEEQRKSVAAKLQRRVEQLERENDALLGAVHGTDERATQQYNVNPPLPDSRRRFTASTRAARGRTGPCSCDSSIRTPPHSLPRPSNRAVVRWGGVGGAEAV
jgi:hypothetical protein